MRATSPVRTSTIWTMAEATRTELAVLGLLAWAGESSGYELNRRAERSVGFIWAPARSQLYAVLKRLDAAGLVQGRRVTQTDRPDKRLFSLSDAGRETPMAPAPQRQVAWPQQQSRPGPTARDRRRPYRTGPCAIGRAD